MESDKVIDSPQLKLNKAGELQANWDCWCYTHVTPQKTTACWLIDQSLLSYHFLGGQEVNIITMLSLSIKLIVVQKEGNTTHLIKIITIQQTTFITTHHMIYLCG